MALDHTISEKEKKKSDIEKIWAEIFLKWLNNKYHFDYFARPVFDTSGTDIEGVSSSGIYLPLKIELTEAKRLKRLDSHLVYDNDQVQKSIIDKEEKYKENVSVKETILLIQGHLHYDWMSDDIKRLRQENRNSPFRGIYYVYHGSTNHPSFIVDIKHAFEQ